MCIVPQNAEAKTQRRISARRILSHVVEVFPPARQGTILNNHRIIGIATNT